MAEKLLEHALAAEDPPLGAFRTASAGLAAFPGDPASDNSVAALKRVNLDLSGHLSQPMSEELAERAFAIFGMTQTHVDIVRHSFKTAPERLHLFREFLPGDEPREISDPIGRDFETYLACLDSMVEAIPSILDYLRKAVR
jgi:protein-tyrosine-phosphatase